MTFFMDYLGSCGSRLAIFLFVCFLSSVPFTSYRLSLSLDQVKTTTLKPHLTISLIGVGAYLNRADFDNPEVECNPPLMPPLVTPTVCFDHTTLYTYAKSIL